MINDNVYFGKGKIKGIAVISRRYWDEGTLSSNEDKILFNGNKGSAELTKSQIKSMEWVKRRGFKVIRITMHNGDFYHISSVPDVPYTGAGDVQEDFSSIAGNVKLKNKGLYNVIEQFLNPSK